MKSLLPILAAATLLDAPGDPAQDAAGEPRSLLAAVPEDVIFVAHASDLEGLRAAGETNAWCRMLRDPELVPWIDALRASVLADIGEDAADPEAALDLFLASLRGSLVLFATGSDLDRPDFGFLFDPGAGRASFEEFLASIDQGDDDATSYQDYGGVSLAVAAGDDGSTEVEFEVDGVWSVAEAATSEGAVELAQGIIDRLRGSGEADVTANVLFAAARAGAPPGRIEFFADAQRLVAAVREEEELDERARRALDLIGVQHLSWLHGSMDLGAAEETDLHLRMALPGEGYLADWLAALGPLPQGLAALGPASAIGASLYNVDLFAIYESVWDLVNDMDPAAYEQARAGLEGGLQAFGGLDPEGDFLAQLTGEFASFNVPVPEEEFTAVNQALEQFGMGDLPEALRVGEVYVVGLEDAARVELFLEQALGVVGGFVGVSAASIESEDFQGFQVQSLALPMGMSFNWCFTDDFVAGSLYPTALRSALALHGKQDAPSILTNKHFGPHIEQHARASVLGLAPAASSMRMLLSFLGMVSTGMQPEATWDNSATGEPTDWPFAGLAMPDPSLADRYLEGTLIFKLERGPAEVAMAFMTR
jgi:hypothetical protein